MSLNTFTTYRKFVAMCSADPVAVIEVAGIKNPQSELDYDSLELEKQQEQFVHEAGGEDNPAPMVVKVIDTIQDGNVHPPSDWMNLEDVQAWIAKGRGVAAS